MEMNEMLVQLMNKKPVIIINQGESKTPDWSKLLSSILENIIALRKDAKGKNTASPLG